MYPLMLNVSTRTIVIVGGGRVAARKARLLIECGARRVRVVAPAFGADLPEGLELVEARYEPEHLDGASLVFAATDDPKVNAQVVADAHGRNLLVCRADGSDESAGNFATPAVLRKGAVAVTVSAGSAALSAMIRDGLGEIWDPAWSAMAEAMRELRPKVLASGLGSEERSAVLRDLATAEAMEKLKQDGVTGLKRWLAARHPGVDLG
jgi:siroheme synthase-like protein